MTGSTSKEAPVVAFRYAEAIVNTPAKTSATTNAGADSPESVREAAKNATETAKKSMER
jgi:hypothetical protein